jgi:hypothetical protein
MQRRDNQCILALVWVPSLQLDCVASLATYIRMKNSISGINCANPRRGLPGLRDQKAPGRSQPIHDKWFLVEGPDIRTGPQVYRT